jgi:bifunctional DNase/RNase
MIGHIRSRWLSACSSFPAFTLAGMLPALLGLLVSACHAATKLEEPVQVEVRDVRFDQFSNSPVVILQDADKKKAMPIWVGPFEAQAIALELQGTPSPRPLTHDLMKTILEQVGVTFDKVVVSELKGSTYYAHIHLTSAGKPLDVDSRPSDAIALALRFHRPIFVAKELFDTALPLGTPSNRPEPASLKISGVTVQNLTAELAAYFNLPETKGVLVADVGTAKGADALQRGDVIVAVEGEAIEDVASFRDKLGGEKGKTVTLHVQRDGKEVQVRLAPTAE